MSWRVTLIGLAAVVALGCGNVDPPPLPREARVQSVPASNPPGNPRELEQATVLAPIRQALLEELNRARTLWDDAAPREYQLTVSQACFCDAGTPFKSRVRGTHVVSGTGGLRSAGRRVEPELRTVDALFDEAERLIRSNAEGVAVRFDSDFGYPALIEVDRWRDAFDDEWTWSVEMSARRTQLPR